MVREALLRILQAHGSGRRKDDVVSVRHVDDPLWEGAYAVSIGYPAPKTALPEVLESMETSTDGSAGGVWILNASEA